MKTFNRNKPQFFLLIYISLLLLACGKSPEDARKELGQMNIEYSEASFIKCAERGDSLAVKLFLDSGMDPNIKNLSGMTPLLIAARSGRENVISILLQKGANLNAKDKEFGHNAILFAAESGNLNAVKLLLSRGGNLTDISNSGQTILMRAVLLDNNIDLIKYLLDNGLNINAKDEDGYTPLLQSIITFKRNIDIVKLLLDSGADINATDKNGDTALMKALIGVSDQKSIDVMEILLKSGMNVNATNKKGNTALHECSSGIIFGLPDRVNIANMLLKYGANPNIENNDGETPIDILENYQREINLKFEVRQIIGNLKDNLKKAAVVSPLHLIVEDRLNVKYGVVELCKIGKKPFGNMIIQFNNKHVLTVTKHGYDFRFGFKKYFKDFEDDVVLIYEGSETAHFSEGYYKLLTIKKDGSFTLSQQFGNGEEYKEIIIGENNMLIIFPDVVPHRGRILSPEQWGKRNEKKWVYKNGKVEKVR